MSASDIKDEFLAELRKPEARVVIKGIAHVVFEGLKTQLEALEPGIVKALAGGLIDALAERGISTLEGFVDHFLSNAGVTVQVFDGPDGKMTVTETPV